MLSKFDANNDGSISDTERTRARRAAHAHRARLMARLDTNEDGNISDREWDAFHHTIDGLPGSAPSSREAWHKRHSDLVKKFDQNGDGRLNRDEGMKALHELNERRLDTLEMIDMNADGAIDDDERLAVNPSNSPAVRRARAHHDHDHHGHGDHHERRVAEAEDGAELDR